MIVSSSSPKDIKSKSNNRDTPKGLYLWENLLFYKTIIYSMEINLICQFILQRIFKELIRTSKHNMQQLIPESGARAEEFMDCSSSPFFYILLNGSIVEEGQSN